MFEILMSNPYGKKGKQELVSSEVATVTRTVSSAVVNHSMHLRLGSRRLHNSV
jgi:hypothetical protein